MENYPTSSELIVDETVDGIPVDSPVVSTPKRKRTPSAGSESSRKTEIAQASTHRKSDKYIWGIYICLLIVSIIEVFSASATKVDEANVYSPLLDHGKFLLAGLLIVLGFQKLHYKWYRKYAFVLLILSIGMLIYTTLWGAEYNDAKRAIRVLGITIQPPEIVKLTMALYLAKVLATNQQPGGVNNRGIVICAVSVVLVSGILWINGLTNALMVMVASAAMFMVGGIEWRKLGYIFLIYSVCGGMLYAVKYADHEGNSKDRTVTHESRIAHYLRGVQPDDTVNDDNRQVYYATMALAHGEITGNSPGNSRESARLPLAYSDYIYAIVVEDIGFIGGVALLLLYLCLLARAGRVASKCRRAFPALLIMGCAVMIVLQALVHMIIVVGLGPVSGQPLPFISKGGTSIMVMSAAVGMMLSVSRYAVTTSNKKDISAELRTLPEDLHSENPSMLPGN